jgi:hypothetical protein
VVPAAYALIVAFPYYLAPLEERPRLAVNHAFRSSGAWGHALGIFGGCLLAATLLYPLRKRWSRLRKLGRMAAWLRFHIVLGLSAPLLVTLHSTFKFGGLVAVSYWSMIAVMASGVLGRYIYAQIPRSINGTELLERELAAEDAALLESLKADLGGDPILMAEVGLLGCPPSIKRARGMKLLAHSVQDDTRRWWRGVGLRRRIRAHQSCSAHKAARIAAIARRRAVLQRRVAVLQVSRDLFRHWHTVHKPFAYVMFIIAVVHVVVALLFLSTGGGS